MLEIVKLCLTETKIVTKKNIIKFPSMYYKFNLNEIKFKSIAFCYQNDLKASKN